MTTVSVDLGSGPNPRNLWNADKVIGFDTFDQDEPKVIKHNLLEGTIPLDDNYADYVTAFDFLEHVDRVGFRLTGTTIKGLKVERFNPFLDIMSEIWRILKPGGKLHAFTPVLPNTNEVYRDPTHTNVFTPDMVNYFVSNVGNNSMLGLTQHYGFKGEFKLLEQRFEGAHVVWNLEAVK